MWAAAPEMIVPSLGAFLDYTVNGLIVGNIYALLAVGLALIFGVSHLINFAHGSVYMIGAYIGWAAITFGGTPLPVTLACVALGCGLLGMAIERLALRPLANAPRIAPLLATIGISVVLDQLAQLAFTADPRSVPSQVPDTRFQVGAGTIGALDILIAGIGFASAAGLYGFLRFTKLGWAVRATAQDRDAAQQVGVDINRVNATVYAIAGALGGISGLLVGMYYNSIDPYMSFQATLKGIVAQIIGGLGNVPGAIAGSLLLGLTESYGIALFGTTYRNLFAFVVLLLVLVLRPNGIFTRGRTTPPEPLAGTFIAPSRPVTVPLWVAIFAAAMALALPLVFESDYLLQTLSLVWLYAIVAMSLTLVSGTAGLVSLGHAALLAIGAYASALIAMRLGWPVWLSIPTAGIVTAALGTLLVLPAFRLRGHYVTIATLAVGEIVILTILNWESLTRGPIGLVGVPPLTVFGQPLVTTFWLYEIGLVTMLGVAALQLRLGRSHLGRTLRAIRDDDVAARSCGIALDRYKGLAFVFAGCAAGISGALMAHSFSYINHETFGPTVSILALTMVILGGMGNVAGAIVASLLLVGLPELLRAASDYRILLYGLVLLLLVRFRPQGLFGTV